MCVYRDTGVAVTAAELYATHWGETPSGEWNDAFSWSTGTVACTLLAGHKYGMLPAACTAVVAVSSV